MELFLVVALLLVLLNFYWLLAKLDKIIKLLEKQERDQSSRKGVKNGKESIL